MLLVACQDAFPEDIFSPSLSGDAMQAGHAPPFDFVNVLWLFLPYVLYSTHAAKEPHFGALIGKSEIFIAFCRQQF